MDVAKIAASLVEQSKVDAEIAHAIVEKALADLEAVVGPYTAGGLTLPEIQPYIEMKNMHDMRVRDINTRKAMATAMPMPLMAPPVSATA